MWIGDPTDTTPAEEYPESAAADVTMPMDLGSPHVSLAGWVLALLLLKFGTESNVLSLDVAEVRVSLVNIVNVGMMSVFFIILFKLTAAGLLRRGVVVPGLNDLAGAI